MTRNFLNLKGLPSFLYGKKTALFVQFLALSLSLQSLSAEKSGTKKEQVFYSVEDAFPDIAEQPLQELLAPTNPNVSDIDDPIGSINWQEADTEYGPTLFLDGDSAPIPSEAKTAPRKRPKVIKKTQPSPPAPQPKEPVSYGAVTRRPQDNAYLKTSEVITSFIQEGPKTLVSQGELSTVDEDNILAVVEENAKEPAKEPQTILINFNNVGIIEYLRFISRVTGKNFIFDETQLNFTVTIVSEEPTTVENVMAALLQTLRINGMDMIEEGNTVLIFSTETGGRAPGTVVSESLPGSTAKKGDIVTRVFRLNTAYADSVAPIIQANLSQDAIVQVLLDSNHIIVTDIASNVAKIHELIQSVDAPNSSMIIGQYVVRNTFIDVLIQNAESIMVSIAPGQPITFVPHIESNSVFIVASPFLVERAIPILQRLDQSDATTGIFNLNDLRYDPGQEKASRQTRGGRQGVWELDQEGNWNFQPLEESEIHKQSAEPQGTWKENAHGHWEFFPGKKPEEGTDQPKGSWQRGADNKWRFALDRDESIFAGKRTRTAAHPTNLPLGHIEKTKFYIHKLQYRGGQGVADAIVNIGGSMGGTAAINSELLATINSVQWLEESNSLVFTGTPESLLKVKELVEEIDQPLRQVFIEMLILETTVDDSLEYGVNFGTKFGGGDSAGAQAFITGASPLNSVLSTSGLSVPDSSGTRTALAPTATSAIQNVSSGGYNMGIIGQKLRYCDSIFNSITALVKAVHEKSDINVVMNPKILAEDNVTAEIFVGINTAFKTESISNDEGSILTNNFEYRNVGTTLRVTPHLGPTNIITLDIEEEVSNVANQANSAEQNTSLGSGPTTRINRTKTKVHIPDEYFLIISGLISDEKQRSRQHVPCLGGAPFIGAAFTDKSYSDAKRNIMIFIRPQLIDSEQQIQELTKHQQNIYRIKRRTKKMWKLDCEEALDWLNVKNSDTLNDEFECCSDLE